VALEPRAKEAYNNLGTIYAQRGESERAREMFRAAVEIDPTYVHPRCNLALYLLSDGDIVGAEDMIAPLAEVSVFQPQAAALYAYTRARILVERQEYGDARDSLRAALELVPDHALSQRLLEQVEMVLRLRTGFTTFWERQAERRRATRVRLQHKLTTPEPKLIGALSLYTKEALTGTARVVLPWGGWSALRKADLVTRIADALLDAHELGRVVDDAPPEARSVLQQVLAAGGTMCWEAFDTQYGNDLEESPYWGYHAPETAMGQLRLRGLLVETYIEDTLHVAVPIELRPMLGKMLR
jgi:tetratricopeptide (TPR) repeat protein